MASDDSSGLGCLLLLVGLSVMYCWSDSSSTKQDVSSSDQNIVFPQSGTDALSGGSPTIREPYEQEEDDPLTSNDESNDQPTGHFGSMTLYVCNENSGNCYYLDGDLAGFELTRLYFPKGGWVDFSDCELDKDYEGQCEDENGTPWEIRGE